MREADIQKLLEAGFKLVRLSVNKKSRLLTEFVIEEKSIENDWCDLCVFRFKPDAQKMFLKILESPKVIAFFF